MINKAEIIVVLCQKYPSTDSPHSQAFIHTRISQYPTHYNIKVISFDSSTDYQFEGIKVYTEKTFYKLYSHCKIKLLISHAPNLRNHFRFLISYFHSIHKILFFFHGYEVLNINKRVYRQKTLLPFSDKPGCFFKAYQSVKLPILRCLLYLFKMFKPCSYVFVSRTLLKECLEDLKSRIFNDDSIFEVINNSIGQDFKNRKHNSLFASNDYVCIRPFSDPKYGVDIFIKIAENNPNSSFHLYGLGKLPKTQKLPSNLVIFNKFLHPYQLPDVLCQYKAAILPTRWDSQGVLACEAASLGMPVITSDLEVCREILSGFENVTFVSNENFHKIDLSLLKLKSRTEHGSPYSSDKTIPAELKLINNLITM